MAADAAGAVQETHHGAMWRRESGFRASCQQRGPGLPDGVSLQAVTALRLLLDVFLLLLLFLRWRHSAGHHHQESSLWPVHLRLEARTVLPWLQKSCRTLHKKQNDQKFQWTESTRDISVHTFTSREPTWTDCATFKCTPKKLENAALKENYREDGAFKQTQELLRSKVTEILATFRPNVACFWLPATHECQRPTRSDVETWRRVRLKSPQMA